MLIILDKKQTPVGIADFKSPKGLPYYNDLHREVVKDNLNVFDFEIPANHPSSTLIEEEGYIIYTDMDNRKQLFIIKNISESFGSTDNLVVECENASTGDLITSYIVPSATLNSYTLEQAVTYALTTSEWQLGECAYLGVKDFAFENWITVKEALNAIVAEFGAEIEYEVIFNGTEIERKLIHVVEKRGQDTKVVLEVSKDVIDIQRDVNSDALYTGVIAEGKDGLTLVGYNGGEEEGFPVTDYYISNLEAHRKYAINNKHKMGFYQDDSENQIQLYGNALKFLKEHGEPKYTYTVNAVTLERITGYSHKKLRIGDVILVKDFKNRPNNPLILEARVVEMKRSKTNPSMDSLVLGDYNPITFTRNDSIIELQRKIKNSESRWEEVGESIIKQDTAPANPKVNELWLVTSAIPNILRRWDGYGWVDATVTSADQIGAFPSETGWDLADQVSDIDNRTSDVALIGTVAQSADIKALFDGKANVEDISGLATGEMLEGVKTDATSYTDSRVDYTLEEVNKVSTSLDKTASDIRMEFASSKGVNMLKNSIGFADTDFWTTSGTMNTRKDEEVESVGYGSGWYSVVGESGYISQVVNIPTGSKYTLSFLLNKSKDALTLADAVVEIDVNGATIAKLGKSTAQGTTNGYEVGIYTFETTYSQAVIRVKVDENAEATITGLMLNKGEQAFSWSHHAEEIYNTNITFNQLGIKVKNGNTGGYTIMSPEEFSGYGDVDGEMQRIFTLNGATTEVEQLDVNTEINMHPVKIRTIKSDTRNGWAFIPSS
jgi:phage minor structural protein